MCGSCIMGHKDHIASVDEYSTNKLHEDFDAIKSDLDGLIEQCNSFKGQIQTLVSLPKINSEKVNMLKNDMKLLFSDKMNKLSKKGGNALGGIQMDSKIITTKEN